MCSSNCKTCENNAILFFCCGLSVTKHGHKGQCLQKKWEVYLKSFFVLAIRTLVVLELGRFFCERKRNQPKLCKQRSCL